MSFRRDGLRIVVIHDRIKVFRSVILSILHEAV